MSVHGAFRVWTSVSTAALAPGLGSGCTDQRARTEAAALGDTIAAVVDGARIGKSASEARFVATIDGFRNPESVRYDADQDVFFVSNVAGYGSVKDGNGYVSRISAADPARASPQVIVRSGRNGALLHAPKGMALHGDTLWVADIDVLRGFDRRTGSPLATLDFVSVGAVLLNDVAVGPDGTLRVTDTGIRMDESGSTYVGPARVFAVGPGGITVAASGSKDRQPNGITWDAARGRWLVLSFNPFVGEVLVLEAGGRLEPLHAGPGELDGVEALPSGGVLYSSWADSSLHLLAEGRDRRLIVQLREPADIGFDTRRHRVAIPMLMTGWVQVWSLGGGGRSPPATQ